MSDDVFQFGMLGSEQADHFSPEFRRFRLQCSAALATTRHEAGPSAKRGLLHHNGK